MRVRIPLPYTVCLVGGMAIGLIFGHRVFPELEAMFGDPVTDVSIPMRDAVKLLDERKVDFEYDGYMSPDAALDPGLRVLYR